MTNISNIRNIKLHSIIFGKMYNRYQTRDLEALAQGLAWPKTHTEHE